MEKLRIWGENIPGQVPEARKRDRMVIRRIPRPVATMQWMRDVFGTRLSADAGGMDTFTWLDEIEPGKVSAFMDDVPTLTPYPAQGSDRAVIVVPGGGFCNQSRQAEGEDIAVFLQSCGLSAFVLEYRMNPYEAPIFYLDLQRAIRYLRTHAGDYGFSPANIDTIGFSAGGYIVGAAAMLLGNAPVEMPGYTPDEIDQADGRAASLGMIYPVTHFEQNPNMLCVVAGDDFFDEKKRQQLMRQYSLIPHVKNARDIPQFLCYGTRDPLKGFDLYNAALEGAGVPHRTLVLQGASHGFALGQPKYSWWADDYVHFLKELGHGQPPLEFA